MKSKSQIFPFLFIGLAVFFLLIASRSYGQKEEVDDDQMIKDAGNPVATLINLPVQDNIAFGIGPYNRTAHVIRIQPIRYQLKAGKLYKVRSRSIIPLIYQPDITKPDGGTFGLGDIVVMGFFTPNRLGKYIWGVGPVLSLPTATDKVLGSGKWSVGPALVLAAQRKNWLAGIIAFNVWSFAGDSGRDDVNSFQLEYFLRLHLGNRWMFVSSPRIQANWNAAEGEQWLVPVGGGIGKMFLFAKGAISLEAQAFYSAIHPESLPFPDWTMRIQVQYAAIIKKS
jgi:hypothetical protein